MERKLFALAIGAILTAAAFVVAVPIAFAQQTPNTDGKDQADLPTTAALLPDDKPASGNYSAAGNYTIGPEGFGGNETNLAQLGPSANTTALKMHIQEARNAMNSNDTQGALVHVIEALSEIESILSGNSTNATSTAASSNATSMNLFGNTTGINDGSNMTTFEEMANSGKP